MDSDDRCDLVRSAETLAATDAPPWSPACRETERRRELMTDDPGRTWCLAEVDIFADLSAAEMEAMAQAAPMRRFAAGEVLYSPQQRVETLFILKQGRVRIFRLSPDGRALTTSIVSPGTIFGEMVVVGQLMHDNFAEAMEDTVVCVMGRDDVKRMLLGDPRIAARISEILGQRLSMLEQRLSDAIFKSVPERVADTLVTLSTHRPLTRNPVVQITHEQLAALVGTSRETATKVLGELADRELISLGRGRISILDQAGLRTAGAPGSRPDEDGR